jgi:DNA-binding CsgD family transcriptional regulator
VPGARRWAGIAVALTSLGMTELSRGNLKRAAASLEEVLSLMQGRGDRVAISYSLLGLAGVAASRGHPARAARLWGAAEATREAAGFPLSPFTLANYDYEGYLAAARAGLDEQSFAAAWAAGREMTPEQATEYALSEVERPSPLVPMPEEPSAAQPPVALTRRERQVASLVAQDLTNRQIASELFISERTVDHHVEKILKKLDLSSCEQVASRLAE